MRKAVTKLQAISLKTMHTKPS